MDEEIKPVSDKRKKDLNSSMTERDLIAREKRKQENLEKKRNIRRVNYGKMVAGREKGKDKKKIAALNGNPAEQLQLIIANLLKDLIAATQPGAIGAVRWDNAELRKIRKDQMGDIKDQITIIKQLKELMVSLEEESSKGKTPTLSEENIIQLEDAREALKRLGVKHDI